MTTAILATGVTTPATAGVYANTGQTFNSQPVYYCADTGMYLSAGILFSTANWIITPGGPSGGIPASEFIGPATSGGLFGNYVGAGSGAGTGTSTTSLTTMPTASQFGSIQTIVSLDGVSVTVALTPGGNTPIKPTGALAAAIAATIASQSSCTLTVPTGSLTVGQSVAVFWTAGGVAMGAYDATVSAVTTASPNDTVTLTNVGGTLTASYFAASGSAPTSLPANGTSVLVSIATDITNSVEIVGSDLQMLLITSNQPGLCELFDSVPTQRRLSYIGSGGGADYWPTAAGQSVPFSQTVVRARMYNNSLSAATMTVVALAA